MGDYTVLTDVGSSIVKLLQEHMTPEPISKPEKIGLCSPADPGDFQLTLYLYYVEENGDFRQNGMITENLNKMRYPPLSLKLHYLLTAHSKTELHTRSIDESKILGKAMQVLFDNNVLAGSRLEGGLKENRDGIQINMNKLTFEELQKIWAFPGAPYKLSVSYSVQPVLMNSTRMREIKRITDAQINLHQYGGDS